MNSVSYLGSDISYLVLGLRIARTEVYKPRDLELALGNLDYAFGLLYTGYNTYEKKIERGRWEERSKETFVASPSYFGTSEKTFSNRTIFKTKSA